MKRGSSVGRRCASTATCWKIGFFRGPSGRDSTIFARSRSTLCGSFGSRGRTVRSTRRRTSSDSERFSAFVTRQDGSRTIGGFTANGRCTRRTPRLAHAQDVVLQKVFLTSLHLAVSNDGATDNASAFQKTWEQFAGPANVRTWKDRDLFYYLGGVPFESCALDEESLLTQENGSGQCGSWAYLLIGALGVNGIPASFVQIRRADDPTALFAVKHFSFSSPSFPEEPAYRWKMRFNPSAVAAGDIMVPKQPDDVYGDLTSLTTLHGQNTAPPSEKCSGRTLLSRLLFRE